VEAGIIKLSTEELFQIPRQLIYVQLHHRPAEQRVDCPWLMQSHYQKIITLDQQRVDLVEQENRQQLPVDAVLPLLSR